MLLDIDPLFTWRYLDGIMVTTLQRKTYTLDMLRDEVRELVMRGIVTQQQPIYTLCRYVPEREWECFEIDLEEHEFLMRDRICDLLNHEHWNAD